MENQELLAAIGAMMDSKLSPVIDRLDKLEQGQTAIYERLDAQQESLEEVRSGVNALLEWSEGVGEKFEMPLRPAQ